MKTDTVTQLQASMLESSVLKVDLGFVTIAQRPVSIAVASASRFSLETSTLLSVGTL